jgi:N-acetylmuramoyl-L-alanine amidase
MLLTISVIVALAGTSAGVYGTRTINSNTRGETATQDAQADEFTIAPLTGPITVALQPGHWKIDELPAEHARRNRTIGAIHKGIRELDINLAVVDALVPLLRAENWDVIVVPATVPPGLRADAFISIHADWASDPERRGWKLAPPWRPSDASRDLSESLKDAFRGETELPEDVGGVTVGMRGYFGFSPHRYEHATSPYTPATLIELGFVTNDTDRDLMVADPSLYAEVIHRGLVAHFSSWDRNDVASLVPQVYENLIVRDGGATVRLSPEEGGSVMLNVPSGTILRPVDKIDGWYEVRFRNPFRTGWVSSELVVVIPRLY